MDEVSPAPVASVAPSQTSASWFPRTLAILVTALGFTVMTAWSLDYTPILQIRPGYTPMVYHTALGFFLCGLALWFLLSNRITLALVLSSLPALLGLLTLLQYGLGLNLGLDHWPLADPLGTGNPYPGRMAPNTAICFLLVWFIFLLERYCRYCTAGSTMGILGSLLLAFGGVSIFGYFLSPSGAMGWGGFVPMALHTAVGFMLAGVCFAFIAWHRDSSAHPALAGMPAWLPSAGAIFVAAVLWANGMVWISVGDDHDIEVALAAYPETIGAVLFGIGLVFALLFAATLHWLRLARLRLRAAVATQRHLREEVQTNRLLLDRIQEKERTLQAILDNSGAVIFIKDVEGRYLLINRRFEELFGIRQDELVGKKDFDFMPQERAAIYRANDLRALSANRSLEIEEEIPLPDGLRTYLSVKFPLRDFQGTPVALCGIATDISERKAMEAAQQEHAHTLSWLLALSARSEQQNEAELFHTVLLEAIRSTRSDTGYLLALDETGEHLAAATWPTETPVLCPEGVHPVRIQDRKCIWADVLRHGNPVIHNHQQEMPCTHACTVKPHAPMNRHACAPALEGERVCLILGVGNREAPYQERETQRLQLIVTVVWRLVRRQRAEAALRRSEGKYRELVESLNSGVAVYSTPDAGARFFFKEINRAVERIEQVCREEILGREVGEVFPGVESFGLLERMVRVWQTGVPEHHPISFYQDGRLTGWRENYLFRLESGDVVAVYDDVTQQKLMEQELQQQEEQFRTIMQCVVEGIVELDPLGRWIYGNPAAMTLLGRQGETLTGMDFHALAHGFAPGTPCPRRECRFPALMASRRTTHLERDHFLNGSGTAFPVAVNMATVQRNGREVGWVVSFMDMSAHLSLEEELRHAQKMEAIGVLTGGIAHDFNNLLAVILGYTDLAANTLESTSLARHSMDEVLKAGLRARELVAQLLTFSRRRVEENRQRMHLATIVKEAAKFHRAILPAYIDLRLELRHDNGWIRATPSQVHQVLMNLITNARHALGNRGDGIIEIVLDRVGEITPPEGVPVPGGGFILLEVRDNGSGMSPETQRRIFDPFFTTKDPGEGTGLGLSTVHGVVTSLGGFIRVQSSQGTGSAFSLYFPMDVIETEAETPAADLPPMPRGTESILVVDDEEILARVHKAGLESLGYRVTALTDPAAALEVLRQGQERFELIMLDYSMPGMNGLELARYANEICPGVPVAIFSGMGGALPSSELHQAEIAAVFQKPMLMSDLAPQLRRIFEKPSP